MLTDTVIYALFNEAEIYARQKNLDPRAYCQGIVEPLIRDGMTLDLPRVISYIIKYHKEWNRKNG